MPYEGSAVLAGSALTTEVPTCDVGDRLGDVRSALQSSRFGMLVALNAEGVVLGRLNPSALESDDDATVDQVMREGPTTVRPSAELGALVERMRRSDVHAILVTSSDGRLRGLLERDRADQSIKEAADAHP